MNIRRALMVSLLLTASTAIAGQVPTASPGKIGIPSDVYAIGAAIDHLERQAEEWGTIQMSAPLLVAPDTNFNFNLQRGTSNYFTEAKTDIQVGTASFDQSLQSLDVAAEVRTDPTAAAAFKENLKQFQQQNQLYQGQVQQWQDTQMMLQRLDHLQFSEGISSALAETNAATRLAMLATLRSNLVSSLPTQPTYPTLNSSNNVPSLSNIIVPNTNAASVFSSPQMTGFGGLLAALKTPSPVLNNRMALNIAAGDQVTEAIFRLLGDPGKAAQFAGRQIFFGVATVSVNPGYRTKKDYAANLGILISLQYRPARPEVVLNVIRDKARLPKTVRAAIIANYNLTNTTAFSDLKCDDLTNLWKDAEDTCFDETLKWWVKSLPPELANPPVTRPMAMAISPLIDADVTDAASSLRHQTEFGLSLAGILQKAGLVAQASAIEQYTRRQEQDAHNRSAITAVNTYSAIGGLFGWQISPRFRSEEDPGAGKNGPGNVLDSQTFPSLVMFGFNQNELYPLITNSNGKIEVSEPYLVLRSVPRWTPLKNGWWQKRFSETDRLEASAWLVEAQQRLKSLSETCDPSYAGTADLAQTRLEALKYQMFGGVTGENFTPAQVVPLPEDKAPDKPLAVPSFSYVFPSKIELNYDSNGNPQPTNLIFALLGNNLTNLDASKIAVTTGHAAATPASGSNTWMIVNTSITDGGDITFKAPWVFTNAGKSISIDVLSPTVSVIAKKTADPTAPKTVMKMNQTEAAAAGAPAELTISISPNADEKQMNAARSLIENQINKAKPAGGNTNVSIEVKINK